MGDQSDEAVWEPEGGLAAPPGTENPELERFRINLAWLLKLRWAAAAGQFIVILVVVVGLRIDLPVARMLGIVAILAMSNTLLSVWFRAELRSGRWKRSAARGEALLASIMLLDIVFLSLLLYLSGGPANPFAIFYLVNIALASAVLRARWAWFLTAIAIACFAVLFFLHRPVPDLGHTHSQGIAVPPFSGNSEKIYLMGMLIAVGVASMTLVYFVTRLKRELARREAELGVERRRKAQAERLEAMATLAAGAAHELATPLSTIAVVSKDLQLQLERGGPLVDAVEDARLVRQEVTRCRTILDQMAYDAGESVGEGMIRMPVDQLCEKILAGLQASDRVETRIDPEASRLILFVPAEALARCLRGIVKNALDASDPSGRVTFEVDRDGSRLRFRVLDRGAGMAPEILDRAAEPFFTTKEPGHGMGLGLFLAKSVLDRLGGSLRLASRHGEGTVATIHLPIEDRRPV